MADGNQPSESLFWPEIFKNSLFSSGDRFAPDCAHHHSGPKCADRTVTGLILKPYFRDLLGKALSSERAGLVIDHFTLLFLESVLCVRLAEETVRRALSASEPRRDRRAARRIDRLDESCTTWRLRPIFRHPGPCHFRNMERGWICSCGNYAPGSTVRSRRSTPVALPW
jgi:hypothetical protein